MAGQQLPGEPQLARRIGRFRPICSTHWLLVLGVSFTMGGVEPSDWESIPNEVQGETTNSSVVKLDSGLVLVMGGRPKVPGNKLDDAAKEKLHGDMDSHQECGVV